MTDSSNDNMTPEETPVPEGGDNNEQTVPVKAVAKERAEKRAARAEASALKEQLEQLQSQDGALDMSKVLENLGDIINTTANAAVEDALRPAREETQKYKMAMQLNLNESQADEVFKVMSQYPGMEAGEALTLARSRNSDLFTSTTRAQGFNPASDGGMPVSGESPLRQPQTENFMSKIQEAKSQNERTFWAAKEFERRIIRMRSQGPS